MLLRLQEIAPTVSDGRLVLELARYAPVREDEDNSHLLDQSLPLLLKMTMTMTLTDRNEILSKTAAAAAAVVVVHPVRNIETRSSTKRKNLHLHFQHQ